MEPEPRPEITMAELDQLRAGFDAGLIRSLTISRPLEGPTIVTVNGDREFRLVLETQLDGSIQDRAT
jgi:hypothetical protein